MHVDNGKSSTMSYNKTFETMVKAPIRDAIGNMHLRQCKPKLRYERYVPLARRNQPTTHDIENKLRQSLSLIRITRGLS
jgi:hypothetical protein